MYALVLLMYETKSLDKVFTYKIPSFLHVQKGVKVKVPFNNKEINGIVLDIIDTTSETFEMKEIIGIENDDIYYTDELIDLAYKLKELTLCTLTTAFKTMVPNRLKVSSSKSSLAKYNYEVIINKDANIKEYIDNHKKASKQIEILNKLLNKEKL